MKGGRRFDEQQVAMATIDVRLFERDRGPSIIASMSDAFASSRSVFETSLAGIAYVVSALAPWAALAYVSWWLFGKLRRTSRAAKTA